MCCASRSSVCFGSMRSCSDRCTAAKEEHSFASPIAGLHDCEIIIIMFASAGSVHWSTQRRAWVECGPQGAGRHLSFKPGCFHDLQHPSACDAMPPLTSPRDLSLYANPSHLTILNRTSRRVLVELLQQYDPLP